MTGTLVGSCFDASQGVQACLLRGLCDQATANLVAIVFSAMLNTFQSQACMKMPRSAMHICFCTDARTGRHSTRQQASTCDEPGKRWATANMVLALLIADALPEAINPLI